jgi:hypothetical protein
VRPKIRGVKRAFVLLFALVAGASFAACGGSTAPGVASLGHHSKGASTTGETTTGSGGSPISPNPGGSNPSGATIGMGGVTLNFSACMRSHGVPNFPDPNSQGQINFSDSNPNSPRFLDAQKACGKFISGPSGKAPSEAQQQKMLANALKFAECMRSHGVANYPDPTTGPEGRGISMRLKVGQSGFNPNSSVFKNAQKKCQALLGGGGGKVVVG